MLFTNSSWGGGGEWERRLSFLGGTNIRGNKYSLMQALLWKCGYADELAIMMRLPSREAIEDILNEVMDMVNRGKTASAAFHFNNRAANRNLIIPVRNKHQVFQDAPFYLGVRLDSPSTHTCLWARPK